jgi:hypothetical protein
MGACDGYSRITSYITVPAVNGGRTCSRNTVFTDLCAECSVITSSIGKCDGTHITTSYQTYAAKNGGNQCTGKPIISNSCRHCSTTSTEVGICRKDMITTTYHVLQGMNGGSKCGKTKTSGRCAIDASAQELSVPKVLALLLVFLF